MIKERFYTTPSSLGSYFGVGFNNPEEQIRIDLGLEEAVFDDDAEDRLLLGKILEAPVLDLFENKLGVVIHSRNVEDLLFYGGKIKGKIDGMTMLNGVETVVECKVSNAKSYRFTDNLGYLFQVQAYMLGTNTEQALLCGLYQGKPIYKIIPRNEEMIEDIKEMTDFVVDVLSGIGSFDAYPTHLLSKYSKTRLIPTIEELDEASKDKAKLLLVYKEQLKELTKQISDIEDYLKTKFDEGIYQNNLFKLTLSTGTRSGGVDIDRLALDHPEIDLKKYTKPDTTYRTLRITPKK